MKNNYNPTVPNRGFTHGGWFHADDVFSAALLRILNPDIAIEREFEVPTDFDGIVFDVGGGEFDHQHPAGSQISASIGLGVGGGEFEHHAEPRATRENGVPYAAFGKLWAVYGPQLVGHDQAKWLDETFIQALDSTDNGGDPNPLSDVIDGMNSLWDCEEDQNVCFEQAVDLAYQILKRQIQVCKSREAAVAFFTA